jgi:hypothetical protein
MKSSLPNVALIAALSLVFGTAFAQQPPAPTPPAPAPASQPQQTTAPIPLAGAPAPTPPAVPGQPKPFKEVIKDSQEVAGLFKLHRKDEKVWIELTPEQFDKPFFFSMNIPRSVGERGLYGGQMAGPWNSVGAGSHIVEWRRVGSQVQLIARNTEFFAAEGTPQARFVEQSFSDSLLASAPTASMPHPDTKAVLIEASALLFADLPGYSTGLERAFRMPFTLDPRNSSFTRVNNDDKLTSLQVNAHFAVPKIAPPPLTPSPVPNPPPPRATPDPRSLFVSFQYNFMKLPDKPMPARAADPRLGHFVTSRVNYTDDIDAKPRKYSVARWRLEKKDPAAAMSEPVEPITYWLDKNIPEKYRKSVADGILEWNKAFEKIGFKNAVVAKQQADTDDFDTMDSRHASIRWFSGADVGFAIGPSHIDPRTGEILDADIGMSDVFARGARRQVAEDFSRPTGGEVAAPALASYDPEAALRGFLACNYMEQAGHEMEFASDILEARGLDMSSPEAEAVAQAYVKDVIMHEVGHTLGFRHNFRASTIYTSKQIADPQFTRVNGMTGSVMDYTPFNIALKGEKQGEYAMSTLGPYDYWAVEYAYKPIEADSEKAELARIASRSREPLLAYATDEDVGYGSVLIGIDPDANLFDLGSDPLEYYRKRMKLSKELWQRLQDMKLKEGESYERLTRSFAAGFQQLGRVAPLAAKYVGGVRHVRDYAGGDRPLYEPTSLVRQREALTMITNDFFQVDSFRFKPEFVSRLGIDHFNRPRNPDISISTAVLNVQKAVLDQLMSDAVAARLLDSQEKVGSRQLLKVSDLYDALHSAIWAELKSGRDITPMRRNLQREHLRRVAGVLVRTSPTMPADARSLAREDAIEMQAELRAALQRGGQSKENRAHLRESLDTLSEALRAPLQRQAV